MSNHDERVARNLASPSRKGIQLVEVLIEIDSDATTIVNGDYRTRQLNMIDVREGPYIMEQKQSLTLALASQTIQIG